MCSCSSPVMHQLLAPASLLGAEPLAEHPAAPGAHRRDIQAETAAATPAYSRERPTQAALLVTTCLKLVEVGRCIVVVVVALFVVVTAPTVVLLAPPAIELVVSVAVVEVSALTLVMPMPLQACVLTQVVPPESHEHWHPPSLLPLHVPESLQLLQSAPRTAGVADASSSRVIRPHSILMMMSTRLGRWGAVVGGAREK
eukprot:CAMPEP_0197873340 /NCGR_PEP_ID=MMETSP1439-20131203/3157_1 /TAXON_ID=66791 /ORGANISM="Gonyaulax spinifera, Strain CCMP409" /LENGTH=198 /DNA_ID=CAMNT_0043492385 /DNA_START=125 /DNA_END=721 /DNA_ORIENTATION=+